MTALMVGCLLVFGAGPFAVGQPPPPTPSPEIATPDLEDLFPSSDEVGAALGLTVEAMGVTSDMSQLWEGTDIAPGALVAARLQGYRSPVGGTDGAADDAFAGVFIDIDWFRSADDAARYGSEVGSSVSDPLAGFATELPAEMVATGSWASDDGFGGSTIVARTGPVVVIVTAAKTGVDEMETATEAVTGLVLERLLDERLVSESASTQEPTPPADVASQRVEVPEAGFAITFPADWDVIDMLEHPPYLAGLTAAGPEGYCEVFDWSEIEPAMAVESLDDWLAAMVSRWDQNLAATKVTGEAIDLPAGRAARVAMDLVPSEPSSGSTEASDRYAQYLFGAAGGWFFLGCSGPAHEDDWLSIAESFEFLPREE